MWLPIALAWLFGILTFPPGSFVTAIFFACIYPLQAILGTYALRHLPFAGTMDKARYVLVLIGVALVLPIFSASLITLFAQLTGLLLIAPDDIWIRSWLGGVISIITWTPLITTVWLPQRESLRQGEIIESILGTIAIIVASFLITWTGLLAAHSFLGLFFFFGILLWIALRMRPRITKIAIFSAAAVGISGAVVANSSVLSMNAQLLVDEYFIILIAPIFFFVTSLTTERRMLAQQSQQRERELEIANKQLSLADQSKNEFIASLAHELRNPLAVAVSSLELMRLKARDNTELLELIDTAKVQNRMLMRLIDDLLDATRMERRKFKLQKEMLELSAAVDLAARSVAGEYKDRRHTLNVLLPKEPLTLEADPVRFEQILVNLLTNAARYTEPGGTVTLRASKESKELCITIEDNGRGIEPKMLTMIFEPFKQVTQNDSSASGLGMGLSITKRLVEMHRGRIWAESGGLGKGSKFVIMLPLNKNAVLKSN
jgi:signal transduction histidine kinase